MCQPNQGSAISGSSLMRVKTAAVEEVSAANAAYAGDNDVAESAPAAIIDKFGSKFAAIGSKRKKTTG